VSTEVPEEGTLTKLVTFDFADGDLTVTVEVADGAANGGWGIARIEITTTMPVLPDFLPSFMEAAGRIILTGGIPDLIARHDAQARQ
jgi:hypothetical protein